MRKAAAVATVTPENDLASMLEMVDEIAPSTVDVDVSRFTKREGDTITYADISTAALFTAASEAKVIRKRNPDFPQELCMQISMLAHAHRLPVGGVNRAEFYAGIAKKSMPMFTYLVDAYAAAFPHLQNIEAAADQVESEDFFEPSRA